MADELITFVIDGGDARNGAVSASVFADKLKQFVATIYALERVYADTDKRGIDLEVVGLSRKSPSRVAMRVRSKQLGYDAQAAVRWTVDQLEQIRRGQADPRVPESVLSNVVNLADYRTDAKAEISLIRAEMGERHVEIDGTLAGQALLARSAAKEAHKLPWRPGVSKGTVFGELRGVMDFDNSRQFYIIPPSGPERIQCVFPESLRQSMIDNLFGVVRVSGFLHFDGKSAHPQLIEAEGIENQPTPAVHLLDLDGAFPDLEYEPFVDEVA